MEPIRVLQVVTCMNRGGLESMLMNYYRNIDKSKIQFDFLEHRQGKHDFTDEILSLGGKIFTVPSVNPFNTNGYLNALDNFFQQHKEYSIIHSHLDCMSSYPLKYAKKYSFPVKIAHSHNTNQEKNLKYFLKMYSKTRIPKYTTHLFSCGEEAGKWMFPKKEFQILNNAIDAQKFQYNIDVENEVKRELGLEKDFIIGHIGRFNSQKNHKFLIQIFYEIHKLRPNSKLVLVGIGELQEEIMRMANEFGINDSILFLGVRSDTERVIQAFDVFVFPSLFEGLPVTLIEAQAAGLRCIKSDSITDECCITKNVKSFSLKRDASNWAKEIISYGFNYKKQDTYVDVVKGGFDIKGNASFLEEFYLNEYNKIK